MAFSIVLPNTALLHYIINILCANFFKDLQFSQDPVIRSKISKCLEAGAFGSLQILQKKREVSRVRVETEVLTRNELLLLPHCGLKPIMQWIRMHQNMSGLNLLFLGGSSSLL